MELEDLVGGCGDCQLIRGCCGDRWGKTHCYRGQDAGKHRGFGGGPVRPVVGLGVQYLGSQSGENSA